MSSITLTLTGNTSELQAEYFPSIDLSDGEYVCGLVNFQTFHSIPNVDQKNNLFFFGRDQNLNAKSKDEKIIPLECIKIPVGSYEIDDLTAYLKNELQRKNIEFELKANKNTLKCEIYCNQPIDFTKPNTIGSLLGLRKKTILSAGMFHVSDSPSDVLKVNVIRIVCNIITGSYLNNQPSHTIHEFSPTVPPGYKIIETPKNVIYYPVTVKYIHAVHLSIIDQNNHLINLRGETITIRLHIKRLSEKNVCLQYGKEL